MPRPPIGDRPMTSAERMARTRARRAELVHELDQAEDEVTARAVDLQAKATEAGLPDLDAAGRALVQAVGRVTTLTRTITGRKREE